MITPAYVQRMARYNAWQNNQLMGVVDAVDQVDLDLDRAAFFGSIQGTLSHLLWGDLLWMSRFDARCDPPGAPLDKSKGNFKTKAAWQSERLACDGRIHRWAEDVGESDLNDQISWFSEAEQKDFSEDSSLCIVHFFNHQTHHRGQVHAMLTAAGQNAPVTDVPFMPEDI